MVETTGRREAVGARLGEEVRVVKIGVVEGEGRIELVDWEGRSVGDEGDGDVVEVRGGRVVGDEGDEGDGDVVEVRGGRVVGDEGDEGDEVYVGDGEDEGDEVVVVLSNGVVVVVVSKGVEGGRAVPVGRDGRSVGDDRG